MNDIRTAPRAWAEIDLEAARNNYRTLRKAAGGAKMMCVIKGDAHGHGAVPLGKALGAVWLAAPALAALSGRGEKKAAPLSDADKAFLLRRASELW
ncbi:MAG: alanine racemase, partial [Oscillospiraceae bacterium]|nr:alanine racemase [Oscillospiraceae bacterium]